MNVVFKLLGVGLSAGAGFVGTKLVDFLWEKITGEAPPKSKDGLENTLRSALVFAIISGAVSTTGGRPGCAISIRGGSSESGSEQTSTP